VESGTEGALDEQQPAPVRSRLAFAGELRHAGTAFAGGRLFFLPIFHR